MPEAVFCMVVCHGITKSEEIIVHDRIKHNIISKMSLELFICRSDNESIELTPFINDSLTILFILLISAIFINVSHTICVIETIRFNKLAILSAIYGILTANLIKQVGIQTIISAITNSPFRWVNRIHWSTLFINFTSGHVRVRKSVVHNLNDALIRVIWIC